MEKFFEELPCAITVCDTEGNVVDMNQKASSTYAHRGGRDALIGQSLLNCHPEPARTKLLNLLHDHNVNAYTIEKEGQKKLIYQTPWWENGEFRGYIEFSFVIPFAMPHYVRQPKPSNEQ